MYTCTSILWQEFITQDKVTLFLQLMDHSPYYKPTIIINDNIWAFELNIKFQPMKMMAKIYNTYHTNKTILTIQIRHLDFWSESLSFNLVFNASITSLGEEFDSNLKKTPKNQYENLPSYLISGIIKSGRFIQWHQTCVVQFKHILSTKRITARI